jgi:hypothetical protein
MFESPYTIVVNQAGFYGIPRPVARERAEKYLKQLQLWDKRNGMSRALSGGMKRRLMIARALMHEPRLLILDEPTAGVDIEIRRSMWTFCRSTSAQRPSSYTHYLGRPRRCAATSPSSAAGVVEGGLAQAACCAGPRTFRAEPARCARPGTARWRAVTHLVDDHTSRSGFQGNFGATPFARLGPRGRGTACATR